MRLGVAEVELARADITWDEARDIAILKNRSTRYPLRVGRVREFGVLDRAQHPILDAGGGAYADSGPRVAFTAAVNARLARSATRDIYIYVHGYKVGFENPVLVAAELWHFLGYEGVFIPFSWPSRTKRFGYFGDAETAQYAALFLREFLEYLAEETTAARIHVIGYSAGTRVVATALHQLALQAAGRTRAETVDRTRLGTVVFTVADVDRDLFATYLIDGMARVQERLTIYQSPKDKALGLARRAFGRARVGQLDVAALSPDVRAWLRREPAIDVIDVSRAAGFDRGGGHDYFRASPWVSSDLLTTLRFGLDPAARGLVREEGSPVWTFPPDYVDRLRAALVRADARLAPLVRPPDPD